MQKSRLRLLESKVQIPNIQKEFQVREALLKELARSEERLFVLHATIGYGKTVLMSQYTRIPGHICAWYHLDTLDNEFAAFIQYLVLAIQRAFGDFMFEADSYFDAEEIHTRQMIRELVTEITEYLEQTDQKFILVLDDFQVLDNPKIFTLLEDLLDNTTSQFRLMIATKGMIPNCFSKYLMRGQGCVFGFEALRFRREEVRAVICRMLSEEEAEKYTELIWKNMEGWPAGVMFAVLYLRQMSGRIQRVEWDHISQESLIQNYLTYELFKELPYEIQQFLLHTSFLEELQPEICNEICGIHNAGGILKYLLQENMFIVHVGGKSGSYRYHSMFRRFLRDRAGAELERSICGRIAGYYLRHQEADVAASYAVKAADPELLMMIMEMEGLSMLREGKWKQVSEYLGCLTKSEAVFTPQMWFLVSVCVFGNGEREKGYQALLEAGRQDASYLACQKLYEGLMAEEENKKEELIRESCRQLQKQGWELPPLQGDEKILAEKIWGLSQRGQVKLYVSCFGKFTLKVQPDGKELSWRTRKAMELFAYLIDLEGRPVERKDLLRQLWPDNEPDNAVAMLHNMIYSIRKELGAWPEFKDLIQYKNHQYYLNTSLLETDLTLFLQIFQLAEQGRAKDLYQYKEQVLHAYGSYLEEIDGEWCSARRAYFARAYGKTCQLLAEYCREQNDPETASLFWNAFREADRYSEEALEGLLGCYAVMGERGLMKKVFESSRKTFREELGIEPGEKVLAVYQQGMQTKST